MQKKLERFESAVMELIWALEGLPADPGLLAIEERLLGLLEMALDRRALEHAKMRGVNCEPTE